MATTGLAKWDCLEHSNVLFIPAVAEAVRGGRMQSRVHM